MSALSFTLASYGSCKIYTRLWSTTNCNKITALERSAIKSWGRGDREAAEKLLTVQETLKYSVGIVGSKLTNVSSQKTDELGNNHCDNNWG